MEQGKKKNIVAVTIISILLITLIIVGILILIKMDNKETKETVASVEESNTSENVSKDDKSNKEEKQKEEQKDENKTTTVSFKQMETTDNNLSDDQKLVAKFFDEDYFQVDSYEELVRYADMLKNINLNMYCTVKTILSSKDDTFEAECLWKQDQYYQPKASDVVIIKGKKPSKMIMPKDFINIRGKLIGAETRKINGKSKYLPVIEIDEIGEKWYWYDEETIRKVAKTIFGKDIKVRKPTEDETQKMVSKSFYEYEYFVYLAEFENQSNLNFKVFDIWQSELGAITYNGIYNQGMEKEYPNKKLYITPDLQKYIVFDYSEKDKYIYINIYNRDLKKLWSKEISNVSTITWDATNTNLTFVSDNDFYNINMETGKDEWDPIYVGKHTDIRIVDNGYILLNQEDDDDTIMFLDKSGKIKNKYDLKLNEDEKIETTSVQKVDDNYIILFTTLDESQSPWKWASKYVILDKDGKKINESK